jgi:hypothetical protein
MIVYREQRQRIRTSRLLAELHSALQSPGPGNSSTHDAIVDLLIRAGTLESAVSDVIFSEADGISPTARRLRELSVAIGHMLWHSWTGQPHHVESWHNQARASLAHLEMGPTPEWVETTVPEGYAHYGVYPEMYLEAARRCFSELGRFSAVCLGLRSIGTSLSATVAAALSELGCRVSTYTLRPQGHPFDRRPILSSELQHALGSEDSAHFLLIDEGPGISGSSLAGTAEKLHQMGVDEDRVIFFPSWRTDGSGLRSELARKHWPRHRRYSASFEETWLDSGRLSSDVGCGRLQDVSAGRWRAEIYQATDEFPPVQPQHERRKYLLHPDETSGAPMLLKFAGLGGLSEVKLERARHLAAAGFTTQPDKVVRGFMVLPFVPGAPVRPAQANSQLLDTIAAYLAHLYREHSAEPSVTSETLREMVTVNISEGLGEEWIAGAEQWLPPSSGAWCEHSVALDGRMLPHEWIRTTSGYLKTDAVDHHDDHFFPGCQDIAWDVAGACIELGLDREQQLGLMDRYKLLAGDRTIDSRYPLHAISYLSFRLGYTTMAAEVLAETPDGARFAAARERYRLLLRDQLSRSAAEPCCV